MEGCQGTVESGSSRGKIGVRGPEGKIIGIKGDRDKGRKARRKIINEENKKSGAKDGALRNPIPEAEISADSTINGDHRSPVGKKSLGPPDERRRKTQTEKLVIESRVPDRVKSFGKVDESKEGARGRFRRVEGI